MIFFKKSSDNPELAVEDMITVFLSSIRGESRRVCCDPDLLVVDSYHPKVYILLRIILVMDVVSRAI